MSQDTKTVKHGKLSVEVGRLRYLDEMRRTAILLKLGAALRAEGEPTTWGLRPSATGEDEKAVEAPVERDEYATLLDNEIWRYGNAVVQARRSTLDLPLPTDSAATILSHFRTLDDLDPKFVKSWLDAAQDLRNSNQPDELQPDLPKEKAVDPT